VVVIEPVAQPLAGRDAGQGMCDPWRSRIRHSYSSGTRWVSGAG